MLSGSYFKRPKGNEDNVLSYMEAIRKDVNSNNWESAKTNAENLDKAWRNVIKRIQYGAELDEINDFTVNIARLKGAVFCKDKNNVNIELSEAYERWMEVGK